MAFCGKCGSEVAEGVRFCPGCGADQNSQPEQQPTQNEFSEKLANLNNTADSTGEFDSADIEKNKAMGILAYIGPLVLIPIFAAKESKFARYHSNQGLILCICSIVYNILTGILSTIFGFIGIGFIGTILDIFGLVFLVLAILGIVNVLNGKAKELPIIGKYKILN